MSIKNTFKEPIIRQLDKEEKETLERLANIFIEQYFSMTPEERKKFAKDVKTNKNRPQQAELIST